MRRLLAFSLLLIALLAVSPSMAQQQARARLEGVVRDAATGAPLHDVHVFVSRSEFGTISGPDGGYAFTLPLGAHRLVVSRVGHKTQTHDVMVRAPRAYLLNFDLEEAVLELGEISVSDERDPNWDEHLASFEEFFLGATPNAEQVRILNPEVLDFEVHDGALYTTASEPLTIENRALGYRLEHHLHQFIVDGDETWQDGESWFTEMSPSNTAQAEEWKKNREKAWAGSGQHFFQSLMDDRTRQEGFLVYRVEDPGYVGRQSEFERNSAAPMRTPQFAVNPVIYLDEGNGPGERSFAFPGYLQIIYTREPEDRSYARWQRIEHSGQPRDMQYSWIRLSGGPSTLDLNGNVLDPYSIMYYGYLSFERIADLLPKEYRPKIR